MNGSISFQPAQKSKCKLRCAIFGPSGAGKTFTALRIATGIAKTINSKIAVIDTEFGSASKYADRFQFDTVNLDNPAINEYTQTMVAAANAGYGVLVIDSMTHGWHELLQEIDRLAKTKFKGNTWSAWSEGTPKQRELVKFIQSYPGHIIASMRSKTEWQTESGNNGKMRPVRVGLSPEQGKGIEYEFDMLLEMSVTHHCEVIKDRTGKYQDKIIEKPGEDFGVELVNWLNDGTEPAQQNNTYNAPQSQVQNDAAQAFTPPAQNQPPAQTQTRPAQQAPQQQANLPEPNPQENAVLQALADWYKSQIPPEYTFSIDLLKQKILSVFGRYPSVEAGANAVKSQITGFDVSVKGAA